MEGGRFSSSEGPRPQCALEGREEAGRGFCSPKATFLWGHVIPNMATRWSTNPTNGYTWVHPGIPEAKWESLETGSPSGVPKEPSICSAIIFEHPPQVQAFLRDKRLSAGHTVGLLPLHLLLPRLGTWRSPEGRQVLQGFLGSLRSTYWDDLCLNPSPQA